MNREKNKEYTKRKLIESALELLSTQEYQKTSIDEIARKAGVTKTTFFAYFNSKEELLFNFDLEQLKIFDQQMSICMEDPKQLLTRLKEAIVEMARNLHKTQIITRNLIHLGTISPIYNKLLAETFKSMGNIMYKVIEHGQEKGVIKQSVSAINIAENLVIIYIGVVVQWSFLDEVNRNLVDAMDEIIRNYMSGIEV
ncbi:TetR/AcrR family transcriptional regulator [Paenibacillus sp. LjRoot153]|uniref:TetR/AcrR family transcriptional regulator n=1 Tax=Paenibacillus sp. LjRoot153 TaxID=3342270 RepID=UPI003ECF8112